MSQNQEQLFNNEGSLSLAFHGSRDSDHEIDEIETTIENECQIERHLSNQVRETTRFASGSNGMEYFNGSIQQHQMEQPLNWDSQMQEISLLPESIKTEYGQEMAGDGYYQETQKLYNNNFNQSQNVRNYQQSQYQMLYQQINPQTHRLHEIPQQDTVQKQKIQLSSTMKVNQRTNTVEPHQVTRQNSDIESSKKTTHLSCQVMPEDFFNSPRVPSNKNCGGQNQSTEGENSKENTANFQANEETHNHGSVTNCSSDEVEDRAENTLDHQKQGGGHMGEDMESKKREQKRQDKQCSQNTQASQKESMDVDQYNDVLQKEVDDLMEGDEKINKLIEELEGLKGKNQSKKDLQVNRNRITAQLSRDRRKIEIEYLKSQFCEMRKKIDDLERMTQEQGNFCPKCTKKIQIQFDFDSSSYEQNSEIQLDEEVQSDSNNSQKTRVSSQFNQKSNSSDLNQAQQSDSSDAQIQNLTFSKKSSKGKRSFDIRDTTDSKKIVGKKRATKKSTGSGIEISGLKRGRAALAFGTLAVCGLVCLLSNTEMPSQNSSTMLIEYDPNSLNNQQFRPIKETIRNIQEGKIRKNYSSQEIEANENLAQEYNPEIETIIVSDDDFFIDPDCLQDKVLDHYTHKPDILRKISETSEMLYEVRENFLDRQSPLMLTLENSLVQANSYIHSQPIFKSRQPLYSPFSHQANAQHLSSETVLVAETEDEYNFHRNQVEDMTTSMYCPSANIIAPDFVSQLDSTSHVVLDIGDEAAQLNSSSQATYPEIVGNPMMQLIIPASEINLLNGNLESFFKEGMDGLNQEEDLAMLDEGSQVYYEIGCQVYEVNKIIY